VFDLVTKARTYRLCCESDEDRDAWVAAIEGFKATLPEETKAEEAPAAAAEEAKPAEEAAAEAPAAETAAAESAPAATECEAKDDA